MSAYTSIHKRAPGYGRLTHTGPDGSRIVELSVLAMLDPANPKRLLAIEIRAHAEPCGDNWARAKLPEVIRQARAQTIESLRELGMEIDQDESPLAVGLRDSGMVVR